MSNYHAPKNNDSMYLGGESDWKAMWPKSVLSGPAEYDEENGIPTASFPYPKQTAFADVFYNSSSVQGKTLEETVRKAFLDRLNGKEQPKPAIERQVGGSHYKDKGSSMQPWAIIDAWGLDFYGGNVLKYILRAKHKGGLEDLQKARHYLDKMIEDADPK